ncbi:MAG: protein kinase [Acidobacteriota bacterium]
MALTPGSRLGPYEILAPIGAGGMGEVYRGKDTRLDRSVAIKVLPSHLSESAEARQRLDREARAISALSHPHICALHDVGHQDGIDYLVMEYLEGETLHDRLSRGVPPLDWTLKRAVEIAQALDCAHRQGIVHRDLKPGNVMLSKSGLKLLDFGLARRRPLRTAGNDGTAGSHETATQADLTALATEIGPITAEGTIVGTFQYMSPEQIEGREADARSDIFAFGAVLYEMATGVKAFRGGSQASLISAILRDDPPPISQVQPMTPPALERVVRTCLAKNPDERWQNAHDLASELEWIRQEDSHPSASVSLATKTRAPGSRLLRGAVLAAVVAAAFAGGWLARRPATKAVSLRASLPAPEGTRFDLLAGPVAISPDGTRLAFAARSLDGKTFLYVRALDADSAQLLAGTEGASCPFWSPDGKSIGYSTGNTMAVVPAGGGVPEKLVDVIRSRVATWGTSGVILAGRGGRQSLVRYSVATRVLSSATEFGPDEIAHQSPQFLPDGRHFIYLARRLDRISRTVTSEIRVGNIDSKESRTLFPAESNALYARSGYLLFVRQGDLVARPFDATRLTLSGDPVVVARHVSTTQDDATALASISETGVLAWAEGGAIGQSQLAVYGLDGKRQAALGDVGEIWTPRLSNDGRRVAAEVMDPANGNRDIWIYDLSRPTLPVRMTFDPGDMATPVWSPDDSRIAYLHGSAAAERGKVPEWSIRIKSVRGQGAESNVYSAPTTSYLTGWSADGARLLFNQGGGKSRNDVWGLEVSNRKSEVLVQTPAEDRDGTLSPDGRWLAYMSSESGRFEIYVQPFPGPGGKWQISSAGGNQPVWGRDGKAVYYVTLDGRLMRVAVRTDPSFETEEPHTLFSPRMRRTLIPQYAVFPDGERLLINSLAAPDVADSIRIVQNWTAALPAR